MNVCIPTIESTGLQDTVAGHFGSAPYFTVVNTENRSVRVIDNADTEHGHGGCAPAEKLLAEGISAVACGGMGRRALARLNEAGIRVFLSGAETPEGAVEQILSGTAEECTGENACAGSHGHGNGHGHGPGHGHAHEHEHGAGHGHAH